MLEEELGALLRRMGWTVATAETCTGGLVSQRIISVPGSSAYMLGGVVAYGNDAKTRLLGISASLIAEHGVVSAACAGALAEAARRVLGSNVGLATTGIAGPPDPTRRSQKPVGLVYVAVAWPGGTRVEEHQWASQKRDRNMASSAEAALRLGVHILREMAAGERQGSR